MKHLLTVSILLLTLFSCKEKQGIEIRWTDNLEGDFSFTQEWSYPENVFLNEYGELVCDGLCDTILDKMRDENGRIIKDSITHYYQLLDTTHHYYTLQSEAQAYEWAGTNYAEAYKGKNDTIECYTLYNVATHSSLQLKIIGNKCFPSIELNSIRTGLEYFKGKGGEIKIDKSLFEKGILKAEFDLDFAHPDNDSIPMWWKGKIYTKINTE